MTHSDFEPLESVRELKPFERAVIEQMSVAVNGEIGKAIQSQIPKLRAVAECKDGCGSIELELLEDEQYVSVDCEGKLPVDAWIVSSDGVTAETEFLLFAREGRLVELEFYRPDGSPLTFEPDPKQIEVSVAG